MKIFVTGASGFVGGAAALFFYRQGHTVLGMSRTAATDDAVSRLGAEPVRCDLLTVTAQHLFQCDAVIHAAAMLGQWSSYDSFYRINVAGTENLLRAAQEAGVKKFIYISTESVLVDGKDLLNVDESYPYPHTPFYYSKTKQLAEKAVRAANRPGRFVTVCLRPRMVWGPGDRVLLPLLADAVRKKKFFWIGGGQFRVSTTHVDNLVAAIALSMEKAPGGGVYFVADEQISLLRDFITQLLQTQGIAAPKKSLPRWLVRRAAIVVESIWHWFGIHRRPPLTRLGAAVFSSHCTLDTQKIKRELGYRPLLSVEAGMQQLTAEKRQSIG